MHEVQSLEYSHCLSSSPSRYRRSEGPSLSPLSTTLASHPALTLLSLGIRMQTVGGKRHGPMRMAADLLREGGLSSLYRGMTSPVLGAAAIKSSVFGSYGLCQTIVRRIRSKGMEYFVALTFLQVYPFTLPDERFDYLPPITVNSP